MAEETKSNSSDDPPVAPVASGSKARPASAPPPAAPPADASTTGVASASASAAGHAPVPAADATEAPAGPAVASVDASGGGSGSPGAVLAGLRQLARGDDLARLVHAAAFSAASERRADLDVGLEELVQRFGLSPKESQTPHGDVLQALRRDHTATAPERVLLGALLARGVALEKADARGQDRAVEALLWVAASTVIDPWPFLDEALGDGAAPLWRAAGDALERADQGGAKLSRASSIVAAAALGASPAASAREAQQRLLRTLRDPLLRRLLEGTAAAAAAALTPAHAAGELVSPPRGPITLVLLAMTGILPLLVAGRLVGRFALRIRRPAELRVTAEGVTVVARTELLGRTLREREFVIPLTGLSRAAREIRFPRLSLYAGVAALVVGSYVGLRLFIDGVRAGSPEFLALGVGLVVAGLVVDYALSHVGAASRGRCRVLLVPRKGGALALADVDPALADAALLRLSPTARTA